MEYTTLSIERDGPVACVWLNRPERRNALSAQLLEELIDVFSGLQSDFDARVVVLGGRGASFCAGADRRDPPGGHLMGDVQASLRERRHISRLGPRALRAISELEAITITRLHGHAVGGGLALALACDLRIAAADTVFHIPEVDLGVPLGWGAVPRLIAEVGACRAKELILLCERFDATTAERYGLLNRVVAAELLETTVNDWAQRLAAKPPGALHVTKTQFQAYAHSIALGDAAAADGDLTAAAGREAYQLFAASPTR